MIALGDALAFVLLEQRQFSAEQFAKYHPAGSLGRKLATVAEYMRHGAELRIASASATVRDVFAKVRHTGRRTGAIMIIDCEGRLTGLFTDSDLARPFESRRDAALDALSRRSEEPVIGPEARGPSTCSSRASSVSRRSWMRVENRSECSTPANRLDPAWGDGIPADVRLTDRTAWVDRCEPRRAIELLLMWTVC